AVSPVAASTPAPAFVFSGVPSPQALSTPLNTNATRTVKFKNSGNVSVSTVYFDANVVTSTQYPYYKLLNSNFGTVTPITNGYRITLTGAALQSAITTTSGTADANFDKDEEITLVLTEQMTSCALGSSIQLAMKAGSGDSKNSFCFFDSSTASITTPVGNPSISLTRIAGTATYATFCTNGTVSYTIKNEGSGSNESALFNIKLPWTTNRNSAAGFAAGGPSDGITLKKVSIGGVDITSQVLVLNPSSGAIISGVAQNVPIVDLSRLTAAIAGVSLVDLNGDGHFDDLLPGQSIRIDFEYGWDASKFQACMLQSATNLSDGNGYFTLGTSYTTQCGTIISKFNYDYGEFVAGLPGFAIGAQTRNTNFATIDKALFALGDKGIISVQVVAGLSGAGFYSTPFTKVFTVTLPDGLDYDSSAAIKYNNSFTVSPTYINYNATTKVLTAILNSAVYNGLNGNDLLSVPVIATTATAVNKTVVFKETYSQNSCPGIAKDFGCGSTLLNYGFVGNCGIINTTNFKATRTTFGYIPDVSGINKFYRPTGFVNENTPGINLQGALSRDKVRFNFEGAVNGTNYSQLWSRVTYSSLPVSTATVPVPTTSNFDPVSATASEVIGTINVKKGIDGSILTANITVGDVVFTYDSPTQKQWIQVNVGAKIGTGLDINYTPVIGDVISVNWQVRVSANNVPFLYSAITDLKGELYTKDTGGTESGCEPLPELLYLQSNNRGTSNFYGTTNLAGNQTFSAQNGLVNNNHSSNTSVDKFPNETRMLFNIRKATTTVQGIWKLKEISPPYYVASGVTATLPLDPSLFTVSYSNGNTVITFVNDALGSDGLLSPTSNILANDFVGANGVQRLYIPIEPVCVPTGSIIVSTQMIGDDYTGTQDVTVAQSNSYSNSQTAASYVNYKASTTATLQNVDGVGSTVKWQVRVANTTDAAAFLPTGASTTLPNNWMSFVSANNNITVTQVEQVDTSNNVIATYPVVNYGAGKYWVKLGDIATTNTYNVVANYSACTNDKLQFTYSFGATGYPMDPDVGYGAELATCTANQTTFDLNLLPKDIGITMAVTSPQNPVQFCTNPITGSEHMIDYSMEVTNTGTGNAENLILEAAFPANYTARAGTSKLIYDGATRTIGDPVFNTAKGVWQWYISADANGLPFLPPSSNGNNVMAVSYQGETTCGFVSGSSVSYNMNATSGCGQLTQVAASGGGMDLSVVPPALNSYVLTPSVVDLKNDGGGAVYSIEIKNQGSNPISTNENIYITVPSSIDYVAGSVERTIGAANITEPTGNAVVGKTRIITFPLPTGASGNTLVQNETASFNIKFKIVDP
ncbi:hypothetical protein, partial [Flavobacterium sp. HBTb2-11-1]|uniref:hypothetical protein n=1 Tax=Flavobacterium sp. HBTb2-11-1 TaxID=2692212 RepID=UPI00136B70D9